MDTLLYENAPMEAIVCFAILFLWRMPAYMPRIHLPFPKINIDQGLSNNSIRCIYQDNNGFMWFGTYDGLNRYDGYNFKIFRNKPNDTASLPHNYINAIGEDHHNNLWVGTGQGIGIYKKLTSTFLPGCYIPYGAKQQIRIPFNINAMKTDANGDLYIATNGGGLMLKSDESDIAVELPFIKDGKIMAGSDIQGIAIDEKQRMWITITNAGLFLYNRTTNKLQLVNSQFKSVRCMEAVGENLWIATYTGLYKYNIPSQSITEPYNEKSGTLTATVVSLAIDRQGLLWLGTEGGGIDILNTKTEKLDYLLPGDSKNSLSSKTVFVVYEDREGRKWIGTYKGGINIIDPQRTRFQTIAHDPLSSNSLASNFISAFYSDKAGNLWIGSDGGGISVWNRTANRFITYRHSQSNPQSLSNNSVPSIIEDYLGNIWMATFGEGINKFDKATQTFEHYACINDQTGEENKYVWRLYEDRDKNLWATTYANGRLYRFNRTTNRFEVFCKEQADLFCLTEDRNGTLWGGNAYGLCKIDKQKRTFIQYNISKPVRAIIENESGQLWLGTEGIGLILFDKTKGEATATYNDADGLCNNSVLNILKDDKGNLWLSTFHGLSEFNTFTKKFKSFYQEDGLQSNQFEYNAALRLPSGEMVFGGISGFNLFNPDSLQVKSTTPPVFLTGLRINNEDVTAGSKYVSKTDGNSFQKLTIPYDDAVVSFDFTALEYSLPNKISYAYYLEGWDKGWNYSGALRTANYTHLKEGNYKLHIKATNAAGTWNTQEIKMQIVVLPPWFRTWWAYLIYIGATVALIYLFINYRNRQNRLQYEIKLLNLQTEKEKELAHLEIQKEKELAHLEIQKEKELNEKKISLFTGISHEFRTPLTLIINPVKDMLREHGEKKDVNNLNSIYRNARRLISLTDQLLLFQKTNTSEDQLKVSRFSFSILCKEVYLYFVQDALSKKIDYQFHCPEELNLYGDRQKIEIILINLLSNAFKYTPANGTIIFRVGDTGDELITTVSDTGAGIKPDVAEKVFQRFYQSVDNHNVSSPGFGIGLYLAKSFTDAHKGTINYQSEIGKGTTFTVALLKGKSHLVEQSIIEPDEVVGEASIVPVMGQEEEQAIMPKAENLLSDNITLLIVEDNDQLRNYIAEIFAENYKVLQANSAEDGLILAREHLPDLIITDVVMQEMSGMELCKAIKQDSALGHIPVILLTGSLSDESKLQGIENGADDYITKPFEKDFLVARVANLLKNRTVLQNYFYHEITLQKSSLKVSEEYKAFLENCIAVVEAHLDDETFSIAALALAAGMSHSKLYKKVKSVSGLTVNAFIRYIRLRKAAELFINTNMNVNETAFQVGITNVKYFRDQFNKLFGINPSEYIRKYRKAFGKNYRLNKEVLGEE